MSIAGLKWIRESISFSRTCLPSDCGALFHMEKDLWNRKGSVAVSSVSAGASPKIGQFAGQTPKRVSLLCLFDEKYQRRVVFNL